MTHPLLLTVDLGTTNCKAAAFELDGSLAASAVVPYATANPRDGWHEQRPADWLDALSTSVRAVSGALGPRVGAVAGIAVSAWGPGLVLVDRSGSALHEWSPTWQDTRSLAHGRALVDRVGTGWIGGGMPLTGFPAKLAWATEAWPELAGEAAYALGVKDFLLHRLTGRFVTDPSSGPYGAGWAEPAFEAAGWDLGRLPEVVPSVEIAGELRPDTADGLGLPAGLPVACGLNDGAAATLGVGAHREGDAVVSLGTNGVLRLLTASPPAPELCLEQALFRYPVVGDQWACGGFVLAGGSALAWFAALAAGSDDASAIAGLLDEAAAVPPGSDGVVFLPDLVGRGSPRPDPDAAAVFAGLRLRHGRPELTRAVLEGVAFGAKDVAAALAAVGLEPARLLVTGGGAASELWRGIVAGVLGLPAVHAAGDANLGSAMVLAAALGLAAGIDAAASAMAQQSSTMPVAAAGAYAAAYARYLAARAGTAIA